MALKYGNLSKMEKPGRFPFIGLLPGLVDVLKCTAS